MFRPASFQYARRRCTRSSLSSLSFSSTSISNPSRNEVRSNRRTNLIFGSNTDVGKTIVSAGLARASLTRNETHYIKPLQSGGADDNFVQTHAIPKNGDGPHHQLSSMVLFSWNTPASPHLACRQEEKPCSDQEFLGRLHQELVAVQQSLSSTTPVTTLIETAGGVMSPAGASPENTSPHHARIKAANDDTVDAWGWMPQADLYQSLLGQCPVVLVGDGRLGGISATLSSLESLLIRGYDVAAVVFVESSEHSQNANALKEYAAGRQFRLRSGTGEALLATAPDQTIVSLPPIPVDPNEPLFDWYASDRVTESFAKLDHYLQISWQGQVADLQSLRSEGRRVLWWPRTQHGNIEQDGQVTHVDSALGDNYNVLSTSAESNVLERSSMTDASASWWTQGIGHGNSSLALASAAAAGRYGHVSFPEAVHAPAVALAQKLLGPTGPGHKWANRVFFTDNGSTGMEVAVKMAMKTYQSRADFSEEDMSELDFDCIAQVGAHHGDTLGGMNMTKASVYNQDQHPWYEPRGLFLEPPTLGFKDGELSISFEKDWTAPEDTTTTFPSIERALDIPARMLKKKLLAAYKESIELQWLVYEHKEVTTKVACIVIEPMLMCAGGMKFVDPLWQRALMEVGKKYSVPIVFDEASAGLHRLGVSSCREILHRDPDIACYSKMLTGGLLPLSTTLASKEVFEAFLGDEQSQALLHGHSFAANPIGCVAALHALETYDSVLENRSNGPAMLFDESQVREISTMPIVEQSFALGTVLAVTMKPEEVAADSSESSSRTSSLVQELCKNGVHARPLGNVIYIMASPLTSPEDCIQMTDKLQTVLKESL